MQFTKSKIKGKQNYFAECGTRCNTPVGKNEKVLIIYEWVFR